MRNLEMGFLTIVGVGDVLIDRRAPNDALAGLSALIKGSDLAIGNFEGVLTDRHSPTPGSAQATVVPTVNSTGLEGFDVISLANNHSMDAGYGGLADTISVLSTQGIEVVGAGSTLAEALSPVVLNCNGMSVGILAVTSVFRVGTEAYERLPGVAPLRAHDYYGPRHPGSFTPGVPPRVISILNENDWGPLEAAITSVRDHVDLLVLSMHWGDHSRPWVLTEHEVACAGRLVEAGVDVIFGHHHHFMRGMEFVHGHPVFYGLGHLAFDHPRFAAELRSEGIETEGMNNRELVEAFGEFGIYPRPETPNFPFHPIARRTGVAIVEVNQDGTMRCGIVPCMILQNELTQAIGRDSTDWNFAVAFLVECMEKGGLQTEVTDTGWVVDGYDVVEFSLP